MSFLLREHDVRGFRLQLSKDGDLADDSVAGIPRHGRQELADLVKGHAGLQLGRSRLSESPDELRGDSGNAACAEGAVEGIDCLRETILHGLIPV